MKSVAVLLILAVAAFTLAPPVTAQSIAPVIDMHMHALPFDHQGPPLSDEEIARMHAGDTQ